jgi:hypothetical protein
MGEKRKFQKYLCNFSRFVRCYKRLWNINLGVHAVRTGRREATHDVHPTSRGQKERGIAELSTYIDCSFVSRKWFQIDRTVA